MPACGAPLHDTCALLPTCSTLPACSALLISCATLLASASTPATCRGTGAEQVLRSQTIMTCTHSQGEDMHTAASMRRDARGFLINTEPVTALATVVGPGSQQDQVSPAVTTDCAQHSGAHAG
jgi:hypothetical protein